MTSEILYKKSSLEYLKKQDTKIISILGFNLVDINELSGLLRNLELLAKRTKIKEIWIPFEIELWFKQELGDNGYKECILGYHETEKKELKGYKKILK